MTVTIASAAWLAGTDLQQLLSILNRDGEQARVAGGAVRNALLGVAVSDIDIATTAVPEEVVRRAGEAGYRSVPTGIAYGTVTVIAGGHPYEVTTLRTDIETDGRRARVHFGRDWEADARRRDFTINGLFALADGSVIDHVGGVADIRERRIRFIGDAEARIREDYLRILRFFRFFAWYGDGRPDAEGLKACARLKAGLESLSAERVWGELKRLLAARDPSRALLWMRQTGVLTRIVPESERWGIDAIPSLIATERMHGWQPDALLRLEAIMPPREAEVEKLVSRLKLSRAEKERLSAWARTRPLPLLEPAAAFVRELYRQGEGGMADRVRLELANAQVRNDPEAVAVIRERLDLLANWEPPSFPLSGRDLTAIGIDPGVKVGQLLASLEEEWIASDFSLDREALLKQARAAL